MAFTFEQFAKEASKKEGFMNKAVESTTTFVKKAAETTKGIMPVTNRRFDAMVQGVYSEVNDVKKEAWKNKFMVHMLAHHTGMNIPAESDLDALYEEYLVEEQAALEAQENAAKEEAMAKVAPAPEAPVEQSEQPSALEQVLADPAQLEQLMALLNINQQAAVEPVQPVTEVAPVQEPVKEEVVEEQEEDAVPVSLEESTEGQWKACDGCGKDLHITYSCDTCRDCRRAARQGTVATPKPQGTTMRIAFDDVEGSDIPDVIK